MRFVRLQFWLLGFMTIGSCDPGILTQVIIHYRSDYLADSTASSVRITLFREGLEDLVVQRSLTGTDAQAAFPLLVPITPAGGDSARRFHAQAEILDAVGMPTHLRTTIGGFEEGRRTEVVVRLDENCGGALLCGQEQTCVMGSCQAACVLPVEQEGRDETPSISCAAVRKRIRLVGFEVATDVERMPIVVRLTDPDLAREARQDGGDIAFADGEGAALPHELVDYDPNDGSLIAWVLAPRIRTGANTEFFMYFNGASAPVATGAVWAGFEAVWHLDDEGNPAVDQSPLANTLNTDSRVVSANTDGVVHRAREFPGVPDNPEDPNAARRHLLGGDGRFRGFDIAEGESFSVSVWAQVRGPGSGERIIYTGAGAANRQGFLVSHGFAQLNDGEGDSILVGTSAPIGADWTLVTLVVDRDLDQAFLYRNGEQGDAWLSPDISDLGRVTSPEGDRILIGGSGGCCYVDAVLDEVWVERTAWSQARVWAAFHNQRNLDSVELGELERLR